MRGKDAKTTIMLIIGALLALVFLQAIVSAIAQKSHTVDQSSVPTVLTGLKIDRATYVASCKHGYKQTGVPSIGDDKITNYCGCTYDTGLQQFGETVFLQKLASTPLPSDISKIVNSCLQKALR
jgi:hypothetical protein